MSQIKTPIISLYDVPIKTKHNLKQHESTEEYNYIGI